MENWSKTLLLSYRFLETIVLKIDEKVKNISCSSMYYDAKSTNNTMKQINSIIELNDRKTNLINLKVIIEKCLDKLPTKYFEFLTLLYIDGLSIKECAETFEINIRTAFRRKKVGMDLFTENLKSLVSYSFILENYSEEVWLMDLYKYHKKRERKLEKIEYLDDDNYMKGKEIFLSLGALGRACG